MNYNSLKYIYLLVILTSSLFYAFATTKIITETSFSPFTVIILSTFLEIATYLDLNHTKKITKLNTRTIGIIAIFILLLFQIFFFININSIVLLLILYLVCGLLLNIYLLSIENNIVNSSNNVRSGLLNITLLRNLSKIIGFGVGALFFHLSIWSYSLILIVIFLVLSIIKIENTNIKKDNILHMKNLSQKKLLFILLFLGSVSVFTIPKLVDELNTKNLSDYSSLVFILPGIFSILYLKIFKTSSFNNNISIKCFSYISLLIIFLILNMNGFLLILQLLIFSIIVAISISITIDVRAKFIYYNPKVNIKNLLQLLNLITSISMLMFSIFSLKIENIPAIILLLNIVSVLFIIISIKKRGGFYESRTML